MDHQAQLKFLSDSAEPLWDQALSQLKKVDERLWFELSRSTDPARELVVTAEGHIDAFLAAEAVVEHAPTLNGWKFIALKPPMGFTFKTRYEDTLFDPAQMWFLPLNSSLRPDYLGIRVGIPGLDSRDEETAHNALLVILDTGLGERSAASDIHHTEVCKLPEDPASDGYIELPELAEYIAWRNKPA